MAVRSSKRMHGSQLSSMLLVFSFLSAMLFAYATIMLARLSPLYRPLECTTQATLVSALTTDEGENVVRGSSISRSSCANLNPYSMHLSQVGRGDVFVKDSHGQLRPVGHSVVPILTLPANSEGTERIMTASFELPKDADVLASTAVQVITDFRAEAHSELYFLGKTIHVGEKQRFFCGFEYRPLENNKAGHMACAHSVEELVIPAADDSTPQTQALRMNAAHLVHETRRRNTTLGGVMAMSFTLSLALCTCGLASGGKWKRSILSGLWRGHAAATADRERREVQQKEVSLEKDPNPDFSKQKDVAEDDVRGNEVESLGTIAV